jgi:hypothetical protein
VGSKVWVIKSDEAPEQAASGGEQNYADIHERIVRSRSSSVKPGTKGQPAAGADRGNEDGSPAFTVLAYLLGPLSILATSQGRQSKLWISMGIASVVLLELMMLRAKAIFAAPGGPGIGFAIWTLVACVTTVMGFAAWARGVYLLGARRGWHMRRLPGWIRDPGAAAVFGLVVPGFGLHVAGHHKRAAWALFGACAAVVSALVLWLAPGLWRWNQSAGALAPRSDALERVFLIMGAVGLIGAFAWIIQWLDGVRLAGYRTGRDEGAPGDWAAAALLVAIVAFLTMFHPAELAGTLDNLAVSTRLDGLRVIPLCASEAAMRLDPSQPAYALRAIEMNESFGRTEVARAMRQELDERWKTYEMMVGNAGGAMGGPAR